MDVKTLSKITLIFLLNACVNTNDYNEGPYVSPDSKLEVSAFVNRTDNSKSNFAKVVLTVIDTKNNQRSELVTGISDAMKWAIGWYDNNILVAQSSDIGTQAWKFEKGIFEKIETAPEMHQFADQLRADKYDLPHD